ncbi:hypothetical protein Gotur_006805, partial [Gossypium turneri]
VIDKAASLEADRVLLSSRVAASPESKRVPSDDLTIGTMIDTYGQMMQTEKFKMILKHINDHPQCLQVKQSEDGKGFFLVVFSLALVLSIQSVIGQEEKAFDEAASPEADKVFLRESASP